MNRICWWLTAVVACILEPDEREAVYGDFAELQVQGRQALGEVLGLVARRHIALWKHWRPWLTFALLVAPLGMLLSLVSRRMADQNVVYLWLYGHNWTWDLFRSYGYWYEFVHVAKAMFLDCVMLACVAWTFGFVLGTASRGMVRINAVLFCLMLLFGVLVAAPVYLESYSHYLQDTFALPARPAGFDFFVIFPQTSWNVVFYRAVLPALVQAFLVALPSMFGIGQGAGLAKRGRSMRILLWAVSVATLGWVVIQAPGVGLLLNLRRWPGIWHSWEVRLLEWLVYWPVLYLAAAAIGRYRHRRVPRSI